MEALGLPGLEVEQHGLFASLLAEIERGELFQMLNPRT